MNYSNYFKNCKKPPRFWNTALFAELIYFLKKIRPVS
jgi:hypothetical protein